MPANWFILLFSLGLPDLPSCQKLLSSLSIADISVKVKKANDFLLLVNLFLFLLLLELLLYLLLPFFAWFIGRRIFFGAYFFDFKVAYVSHLDHCQLISQRVAISYSNMLLNF